MDERLAEVLAAAPSDARVSCPSHGDGTVRIAFTGDPYSRIGYYTVWCDTCHEGIATDRAIAPAGFTVLPFGQEPAERGKIVPPDVQFCPPTRGWATTPRRRRSSGSFQP